MLAIAAARGELRFGLFLCVPFLLGTGALAAIGILLLMGAVGWLVLRPAWDVVDRTGWDGPRPDADRHPAGTIGARRGRAERSGWGGVVFLGPIPIVFGGQGYRRWMLWVSIAIAALMVAMTVVILASWYL